MINFLCEIPHVTSISTDNFLSLILVSYWLIFGCESLILDQKRNENYKNTVFLIKNKQTEKSQKQTNKATKIICKHKVALFTLNSSH